MPRTAITKFTNRDNNIELVRADAILPYMTPSNAADKTPVAVLEARMAEVRKQTEETAVLIRKMQTEQEKKPPPSD